SRTGSCSATSPSRSTPGSATTPPPATLTSANARTERRQGTGRACSARSVDAQLRATDHFAPSLRVGRDEPAELFRRADDRLQQLRRQIFLLQLRIAHDLLKIGVDPGNDRIRCLVGGEQAEPGAGFVARQTAFINGRHVGKLRAAFAASD